MALIAVVALEFLPVLNTRKSEFHERPFDPPGATPGDRRAKPPESILKNQHARGIK